MRYGSRLGRWDALPGPWFVSAAQPIGGAVGRLVMEPCLRLAPGCLPVSRVRLPGLVSGRDHVGKLHCQVTACAHLLEENC